MPREIPAVDASTGSTRPAWVIYLIAFITGAIVMSFEMLGSRYLNPYFGSGIYTWASLISTVLGALTVGYFIGGWLADRVPSVAVLGATVLIGSLYMLVLPVFAQGMLEWVLAGIDDIKAGSLLASMAILFFPVTFFGMYSPFAIRLMLRSAAQSGTVSGTVYGISTVGSIAGTLGTTFFLLPSMGSRTLTLMLGGIGAASALVLIALPTLSRRAATAVAMIALAMAHGSTTADAQELVDEQLRAALLKRPDGQVARIETEYNDIFITKRRHELTMSFQLKGWDYTEIGHQPARPRRSTCALHALHDGGAVLSGSARQGPNDRARRRIDLDLSRPSHAGDHDRHRGDRPGRHQRRETLFWHPRKHAGEVRRRRRPRVPQS